MKLQEERKRAGMSQSELANLSGVKLRTIQDYEIGRSSIDGARIDTLINLSDALGVPFYDIIEDAERVNKIKANIKREG